jgi:hypothetical protein
VEREGYTPLLTLSSPDRFARWIPGEIRPRRRCLEEIAALVHPEIRPVSKASIIDWQDDVPVVELQSLGIRVEPGIDSFQSTLPVGNFLLAADRILAKAEALLAEAGKRIENGFVPPEPFALAPMASDRGTRFGCSRSFEAIFPVFSVRDCRQCYGFRRL